MSAPKIYDGSTWVELAKKSDIKTYYNHIISVKNGDNNNTANFTLTTSDSGSYNATTLLQKLQALTNSWAVNLPLNGYFWNAGYELEMPLLYVFLTGVGKARKLVFRWTDIDGNPLDENIPILSIRVSDVVIAA